MLKIARKLPENAGNCREAAGRLLGGYREAAGRLLGGCWEAAGRLLGGCRKTLETAGKYRLEELLGSPNSHQLPKKRAAVKCRKVSTFDPLPESLL